MVPLPLPLPYKEIRKIYKPLPILCFCCCCSGSSTLSCLHAFGIDYGISQQNVLATIQMVISCFPCTRGSIQAVLLEDGKDAEQREGIQNLIKFI